MKETFNINFSREKPVSIDYNFPGVFKEFEPVFIDLIKKLKDELEKGTYGILISDDVGGRIPTLTLREIIKKRSNKEPQTVFFPGGREIIPEETIHRIIFNKSGVKNNKSRALLVSEYARSGDTIKKIVEILEKEKIYSDIAVVVSFLNTNELYKKIDGWEIIAKKIKNLFKNKKHKEHIHKIFIGQGPNRNFRPGSPSIDSESQKLSGVYKTRYSMEIIPLKNDPDLENYSKEIQENIKKAREDVKILAEKMIEKVWGSNKTGDK